MSLQCRCVDADSVTSATCVVATAKEPNTTAGTMTAAARTLLTASILIVLSGAKSQATFPIRSIAIQLGQPATTGTGDDSGSRGDVSNHVAVGYSRAEGSDRLQAPFMPTKKDLRKKHLLKRLGPDFSRHWMSQEKPYDNAGKTATLVERYSDIHLASDVSKLNFTYVDDDGVVVAMTPHVQQIVERWLVQRAICRVRFLWRDMGALFWPRWVRHGECSGEPSCSWPPGMHCVPVERHAIRLLRWQCRRRPRRGRKRKRRNRRRRNRKRNHKRGRKQNKLATGKRLANNKKRFWSKKNNLMCKWLKVPYHLTSKCSCSC